jgi:hypothetical protein
MDDERRGCGTLPCYCPNLNSPYPLAAQSRPMKSTQMNRPSPARKSLCKNRPKGPVLYGGHGFSRAARCRFLRALAPVMSVRGTAQLVTDGWAVIRELHSCIYVGSLMLPAERRTHITSVLRSTPSATPATIYNPAPARALTTSRK